MGPGGCVRCAREGLDNFLRLVGRHYSIDEVMQLLERDARLYECSGGGITLGGGEPLYQSVFSIGLLRAARRRGWHTCLETSGQASTSVFEEALDYADLVLFDLKETDLQLHQIWTGVALEPIIRNLVRAAVSGAELRVRLPVVPMANDRDDHWQQVGDLLTDLPGRPPVELMPYRPGKVRPQGAPEGSLEPTPARLRQISDILVHHGLEVTVA